MNETYLSSLTYDSKKMIGKTKYYLGSFNTGTIKTEDLYSNEKTLNVNDNHSTYWIGKVSLIYPSDYYYTYANGVDECFNDVHNCSINSDDYQPLNSWLYDNGSLDERSQKDEEWLITSILEDDSSVYRISADGSIYYRSSYAEHLIRPTLYLKSNVYYVSGDGSYNSPYIINSNDVLEPTNNQNNNSENTIDTISTETNSEDINNQESIVNVPSTLSTLSNILLIISGLLIVFGIGLYGYNYYKLKKGNK